MNADAFLELAVASMRGQIKFDACFGESALRFQFSNDRPPTEPRTGSASASSIAFGRLIASAAMHEMGRVVLKMWLTNDTDDVRSCPDTNAIAYETEVYRYVTMRIVTAGIAPNFVPFVAYGMCQRHVAEANAPILQKPLAKLADILARHCGRNAESYTILHVLVTQSACAEFPCTTLASIIGRRPTHSRVTNCAAILFVLAYALHVLWNTAYVQHNDLHTGNIVMRDADVDRALDVYVLGPQLDRDVYAITSRVLPRQPVIFDWDRASVDVPRANAGLADNDPQRFTGPPLNDSLQIMGLCGQFGQCNRPNERFDLYTLLCRVSHGATGRRTLSKLAPETVSNIDSTETTRGQSGHTCLAYDPVAKRSRDLPQAYFSTPAQFLSLPALNKFRVSEIAQKNDNNTEWARRQCETQGIVIFMSTMRDDAIPTASAIEKYVRATMFQNDTTP